MAEPLSDESSFLELFTTAAGHVEAPQEFFQWSALALVSACLGNRVYFQKFGYQRIYPNLYVYLLGGSGAGKGLAIGMAERLLDVMKEQQLGSPNVYRGSLTRAAMHDEMAIQTGDPLAGSPPMFLITPELSNAVGTGPQAKDLIKFTTEIWEGNTPEYQEHTRTRGKHILRNPCLSWLAGTTPQWCGEVLDMNDMQSGFFARVVPVPGERSSTRIYKPDTSAWELLKQTLAWRLSLLLPGHTNDPAQFEGEMYLTPQAEQLNEYWYMHRPEEPREYMEACWKRQPDQVLKLAMLLKLCDFWQLSQHPGDAQWRWIGPQHIQRAQDISEGLVPKIAAFIRRGLLTHYDNGAGICIEICKKAGEILRAKLVNRVRNYGLRSKDMDEMLEGLEADHMIERVWIPGVNDYKVRWIGGSDVS